MTASRNALSAEYLYELYSTAIRHEAVCAVLVAHMRREYLPDRTFQHIHEFFVNHYRTYKSPPSYAMLAQTFASDYDALELVNTFREYDGENNPEAVVDMLETYIKGVRLQAVYSEVGKLYNQSRQAEAEAKLKEYAEWLAGFTLKDSAFVDVVKTFAMRFHRNRRREEELQASGVKPVTRFYIPDLDELNAGRSLRGQLSCILASTGVGKSHMAKHIGLRADIDD